MPDLHRRHLLLSGALAAAFGALPPAIARALDIPAARRTGTIADVEHVVILTQENRAFDHYFGTLRGVRGFSDRFPIPARPGETVFLQPDEHDATHRIAPFPLNTAQHFAHMRVTGAPHTWTDAQKAWDHGRMSAWTSAKHNHALGYFTRDDIPFQFALAEAFTLCDAYHCGIQAGTDPNRLFLWTGMVDAAGEHNGPVVFNAYDKLDSDEHGHGGYTWTTYPERLTAAGVTWQIYQNIADNFDDNPLVGFKLYRMADGAKDGPLAGLAQRSLRTRDLDLLKADVLADRLPQVSWVVAPAKDSEHPGPSSPAEGTDYTARVLDALTANPGVWAKTVLLINFDENDGFFDHVPPPAPPSLAADGTSGISQIDTGGEYIEGLPSGLGPRVPHYVVSPWSKGGFVNSQVFDHTSVIRFLETRFGVHEPNISAWRRAVCGDLTSCFDFAAPDEAAFFQALPPTAEIAARARDLDGTTTPPTPDAPTAPVQETGRRPARALPYDLAANAACDGKALTVALSNMSKDVACVFQLYDVLHLDALPQRHTVGPGRGAEAVYTLPAGGAYDLFLLGPGGFHRRFTGTGACPLVAIDRGGLILRNPGSAPLTVTWRDESYGQPPRSFDLTPGGAQTVALDFSTSHNWYDFSVAGDGFSHRFAGHIEDGQTSLSDPALGGPARLKV